VEQVPRALARGCDPGAGYSVSATNRGPYACLHGRIPLNGAPAPRSGTPPDGYTIGYAPVGALAISSNMVKKLPYDVLKDFQPIAHVPYKGGAAGVADLISGQVQLMMESLNSITPHAKAGRVRALAVSGPKRSPALPDVPTIAEAGVPGYEAVTWNGVVAPAGVPKAIVAMLNAEVNKAVASPTLKDRFAAIGAEPTGGTPEQFGELIRKDHAKWGDVIRRSGAKID
jgi:tripartite-type tricarboxylate transporter receptor subunit TctC